jgi:hypothetical protein
METSTGFGDTVAKAIKAFTGGKVKPCTACEKRRQMLNAVLPYKPCHNCDKAKTEANA